jgi:hypothetical protein
VVQTKNAQSYRGVVAAAVAGVVLWGGYFFAWHENYIPEKYDPTQLAVCIAGTGFFPGCWVSYGLKMWRGQ